MLSSLKCIMFANKPICRLFSLAGENVGDLFKKNILSTVLDENRWDCYSSLVSVNSDSLLEGYLQTINKKDGRLLVISNGFDADLIAKKAVSMGINTLWTFRSVLYPLEADNTAQDMLHRHAVTHVILVLTESFTGALSPLRGILKKARKVRTDISICIDNRHGYLLHPLPASDDIIDYSINDTHILHTKPSFSFMVAHKPAILAEHSLHPTSILSSIYSKHMNIESLNTSIQHTYNDVMKDDSWRSLVYRYEDTKAQIVNKVKTLLPAIPRGIEQSCYSAAFLVPQEKARLRELLESLADFGVPVQHRFVTPGLPAISFNIEAMMEYEEKGGDLLDVYKGIERVVQRRAPEFFHDKQLLKDEEKYRKRFVYGDNITSENPIQFV